MRAAVSRSVLLLMTAVALLACSWLRAEDRVDGVIESQAPLKAPISGHDVCALKMTVEYYNNIGGSSSRSVAETSKIRVASQATFVVEGKRLLIVGSEGGYPSLPEHAMWNKSTGPAPAGLRGWGREHDFALDLATSGREHTIRNIRFTEHYVRCGQPTSLRGLMGEDRFVLRPQQ